MTPTGVYERKPGLYPGRHMRPPMERLMAKVSKHWLSGCWLWTGAKTHNGYGRIGRGRELEGTVLVHRLMWELSFGPVPDGRLVCHKCDVRNCVNPWHLFLGTAKDNTRDMFEKGRASNGQEKKTQCPLGHPYSGENTYTSKAGKRHCRTCKRAKWRIWNAKRNAK